MKRLILLTTALAAAALAAPAMAGTTKIIGGCEMQQAAGGNYYSRVNPACQPFGISIKTGSREQGSLRDLDLGGDDGGDGCGNTEGQDA